MATCATSAAALKPSADPYVRILRWTFTREAESLCCELGLSADDSVYQLRIDPPWNGTGLSLESFGDAMSAFQRHAAIERLLLDEGWTLESFDSLKIAR